MKGLFAKISTVRTMAFAPLKMPNSSALASPGSLESSALYDYATIPNVKTEDNVMSTTKIVYFASALLDILATFVKRLLATDQTRRSASMEGIVYSKMGKWNASAQQECPGRTVRLLLARVTLVAMEPVM